MLQAIGFKIRNIIINLLNIIIIFLYNFIHFKIINKKIKIKLWLNNILLLSLDTIFSFLYHSMNYLLHLFNILLSNCLVIWIGKFFSQLFFKKLSKFISWLLEKEIHSACQGTFVSQHSWDFSFVNSLSLLYIRRVK